MATPLEEIRAYMRATQPSGCGSRSGIGIADGQLEIAITFAESMARELQASVREWELAADVLRARRDVQWPGAYRMINCAKENHVTH